MAFLPFRPSAPVRARASAPPDPWASKRGFGRLWANLPPALAASLPPEGPMRWLALSPDGVPGHGPAGHWPCRLAPAPLRLYRARGNQGGTKAVGGRLQPKSANPLKPPMYQLPNAPRTRGEARQAAGRPPPAGGGTRRLWAFLGAPLSSGGESQSGGPRASLFPWKSRLSEREGRTRSGRPVVVLGISFEKRLRRYNRCCFNNTCIQESRNTSYYGEECALALCNPTIGRKCWVLCNRKFSWSPGPVGGADGGLRRNG